MSLKRYLESEKKLLDAFKNKTLNNNSCTSCAVGQLCNNSPYWGVLFVGSMDEGEFSRTYNSGIWRAIIEFRTSNHDTAIEIANRDIENSNYSQTELESIEEKFFEGSAILEDEETFLKSTWWIDEELEHYHSGHTSDYNQEENLNWSNYSGLRHVFSKLADINEIDMSVYEKTLNKLDSIYSKLKQ